MTRVLTVLLLVLLISPAMAGPKESWGKAYLEGNYDLAFRLLRPIAEKGDVDAQFTLGLMYGTGKGVPQDYAQATSWYRKAAEQGLAGVQNNRNVLVYGS